MKKYVSLLLTLMLVLSITQAAAAQENFLETSESSVFMSYGSGIDEYSGYIRCNAFSNLIDDYNLSIDLKLQKKVNSSWETVTSWYDSDYNMTLDVREIYPASPGTYRVYSIHKAGGETRISYSPSLIIE